MRYLPGEGRYLNFAPFSDTDYSDIDILIQYHNPPTFDQYMETKFFMEDSLGCSVDLRDTIPGENAFVSE
jgi:hypothetical protein